MKSTKHAFRIAAVITVLLLVLSACTIAHPSSGPAGTSAPAPSSAQTAAPTATPVINPMAKYDPPITMMLGGTSSSATNYLDGESATNNPWSREFQDALGITIGYAWQVDGSQYDSKVNVVIASGDIPDMLRVNLKQYNMLLDAGLIADYTDILPQYTTKLALSIMSDDATAWKAAHSDGKIYGIPFNNSVVPDTVQMAFVRKDWMQKLNLPDPKSMDDLNKIAEAFTTQDPDGNNKADTFGFAMSKDFSHFDNTVSMVGFFNGYHAYPGAWLKDSSGSLVYGSIQPQAKNALQALAKLYQEGAVDKEFAVKDSSKLNEELVSGAAGICFGPFWACMYPLQDLITANPKADFNYYPILSSDGQLAQPQANVPLDGFWVCRKDYKNPEAVVKMYDLVADHYYGSDISKNWFLTEDSLDKYTSKNIEIYSYSIMYQDPQNIDEQGYIDVQNALKANSDKGITYGSSMEVYNDYKKYVDTGDSNYWQYYGMFKENGSMKVSVDYFQNNEVLYNSFYGIPGPVQTERGSTLQALEDETYTKIIMGQEPVDYFDTFVQQWKSSGGDEVAKEINGWYSNLK